MHREYEEDKLSILDISATLNTGTKVNIEIQLNNNHDMIKRSLDYWGRLYSSQLQKGMPYSSLHKTITISLLNFVMFPEYEAFHTTGILWNQQQQKLLSDDIEVHIVEIPKLLQQWREEKVNPWEDSFVRWLLLLGVPPHDHQAKILDYPQIKFFLKLIDSKQERLRNFQSFLFGDFKFFIIIYIFTQK